MDAQQPMRTIDPRQLERKPTYFLLNSIVVPRPIAWVSSLGPDGTANLAPHSYFSVASTDPPIVMFTSVGEKDTLRNVRGTGDFVVNSVSHFLREPMNVTAVDAPPDVSEFELAGLTPIPSEQVRSPRVGEALTAMECVLHDIVPVGDCHVVMGRVVLFHVAEAVLNEKERVDPGLLGAIARMGGKTYSTTADRFDMTRPTYADLGHADP